LVVINPDHVEAFFRHFKTESAHMINGLLGRNKRTLWCGGYESSHSDSVSLFESS
jgi:hypothetical protein